MQGRMPDVTYIASPNCDLRPTGVTVDTLVVHATVLDTPEETIRLFEDTKSRVSAHYVVGRDGHIVQMVSDQARAWHAGVSVFDGRASVNDFSVGIEIVNRNDGVDPFTDEQYFAVARILQHLRTEYDIPDSRVVSHAAIARPVGRKSDPAGFNFHRLLALARTSAAI